MITHDEARDAFDRLQSEGDATDAYGIVRDYLAQQRAASEWQPIATAPRDGTYVLLHHSKWVVQPVRIGMCINDITDDWIDDANNMITATHWMPLPAGPVKL